MRPTMRLSCCRVLAVIIVVTGSRSLTRALDTERLAIKERFIAAIHELSPTRVHHGGAAGPDMWAAMEFWMIAQRHAPQQTEGRTPAQRLYDRNVTMIVAALREGETTMVSCWDGESRGTKHAIDYARELGIPTVHAHKNPEES